MPLLYLKIIKIRIIIKIKRHFSANFWITPRISGTLENKSEKYFWGTLGFIFMEQGNIDIFGPFFKN